MSGCRIKGFKALQTDINHHGKVHFVGDRCAAANGEAGRRLDVIGAGLANLTFKIQGARQIFRLAHVVTGNQCHHRLFANHENQGFDNRAKFRAGRDPTGLVKTTLCERLANFRCRSCDPFSEREAKFVDRVHVQPTRPTKNKLLVLQ